MADRRDSLDAARLYFVTDAGSDPAALGPLLEAALRGGVDLLQLRDKDAGEERLLAAAATFRAAAERHRVPFLINDRPDLVGRCGADGVHVGQDDIGVAEARRLAGPRAIVGLSTHRPEQLEAAQSAPGAARPDYLSVGPLWATPTKPGRPPAGLAYAAHAAANAALPWFAIGGIDAANVGAVRDAGATRIVVVRAIRDADDPAAAARKLRAAITAPIPAGAR